MHHNSAALGSSVADRMGVMQGFPYQLQDVPGCLPVGCFHGLEEYQIAYVRWHGIVSGA